MSESQSVSNLKNRNLSDLRVDHRFKSVNSPTVCSASNLVLDLPILSFEDNIYPGSPCPNENLISMESPHLYEVGIEDFLKKTFAIDGVANSEEVNFMNLDPVLEDSVDINQLIQGAHIPEETLEQIIFDPTGNKQLQQLTNLDAVTKLPLINNTVTTNVSESNYMSSNREQNQASLWVDSSDWDPVTIKSEDIGLSSCHKSTATFDNLGAPPTPPGTPPARPLEIPRGRPGRKPSSNGPVRNNRKRRVEKGTEEYVDKRIRNNIAVRKSRDKAKLKQEETETRVGGLVAENEGLHKKVELLQKELNVLKSLFINVGASLPENFEKIIENIMSK